MQAVARSPVPGSDVVRRRVLCRFGAAGAGTCTAYSRSKVIVENKPCFGFGRSLTRDDDALACVLECSEHSEHSTWNFSPHCTDSKAGHMATHCNANQYNTRTHGAQHRAGKPM